MLEWILGAVVSVLAVAAGRFVWRRRRAAAHRDTHVRPGRFVRRSSATDPERLRVLRSIAAGGRPIDRVGGERRG